MHRIEAEPVRPVSTWLLTAASGSTARQPRRCAVFRLDAATLWRMRPMGRRTWRATAGAGAVALVLALGACSDDAEVTPAPEDGATTTAPAPDDAQTTTAPPPSPAPDDEETTTPVPLPSPEPTAEPTPEPTAEPTAEPPAGSSADCVPEEMSRDLDAGVDITVYECEGGWAYANYEVGEGGGDSDFVARLADGTWEQVAALGSPTCRDDLRELGAPEVVVEPFLECDEMGDPGEPPTGQPTDPAPTPEPTGAPPSEDCRVQTAEYGETVAVLDGMDCGTAQGLWQEATGLGEPSWDDPVLTADGYLCWINPFSEDSTVAGSCAGPDGSDAFSLDIPQG